MSCPMNTRMFCPFCMSSHKYTVTECPDKKAAIPPWYREDARNGTPVMALLAIGTRGHGKSCFLTSFFHTMRDVLPHKWPGFSSIGMNSLSAKQIVEGVTLLKAGNMPPATPVMFPTPVIVKFHKLAVTRKKPFRPAFIAQQDAILVCYDIGGENFADIEQGIKANTPILQHLHTLIFLISLPKLEDDAKNGGLAVSDAMHQLAENILIALHELGGAKKQFGKGQQRNALICFTMADEMTYEHGVLRRPHAEIPTLAELPDYLNQLAADSEDIRQYICDEPTYLNFYNTLAHNFANVHFTSLSALGCRPEPAEPYARIKKFAPQHVLDPILWLLRLEGHL